MRDEEAPEVVKRYGSDKNRTIAYGEISDKIRSKYGLNIVESGIRGNSCERRKTYIPNKRRAVKAIKADITCLFDVSASSPLKQGGQNRRDFVCGLI